MEFVKDRLTYKTEKATLAWIDNSITLAASRWAAGRIGWNSVTQEGISIGYAAGAAGVTFFIRWAEQPGRRNANSAGGM